MNKLIGFLFLLSLTAGCGKSKAEKQALKDDELIREYITANGIDAIKTSSGLYYFIESQGTGPSCNSFSDVRVAYKGYFLDGSVFDQSSEQGVTFNLQQVIKGWTEGIPKFNEGGKGILLIPSTLGYGNKDKGSIPANSVLIFDIELHEVF